MRLGEILAGNGFVTVSDIHAALRRQRDEGGRLGDNIVALGLLTPDQLEAAMQAVTAATPAAPASLRESGIGAGPALNLLLKLMLRETLETITELAGAIKLPPVVVRELLDEATQRSLVQSVGTVARGLLAELRFVLSGEGRAAAFAALGQNGYLGPAPVSLAAFQAQVMRQGIAKERVSGAAMQSGMRGLVLTEAACRQLLPGINAGRTIMLYGPPGNGKTTVASRIAGMFRDVVYIPYAVEVAGQVIRVYDPGLHQPVLSESDRAGLAESEGLQREAFDDRWVACRRPFAIAGGELTLDMLDLQYDNDAKFYEAPLHVKALNGVLLVDDFGRQRVTPTELLNRWITPMENRTEFLKLHTGKSFSLPFDELLLFSTNLDPRDIMDPAFLRRIPYKIKLLPPGRDEFRRIFAAEAARHGITAADDVFTFIADSLTGRFGLAHFQPGFICAQGAEICRAFDQPPVLTRRMAADALANLYVEFADPAG